MADGKTVDPVFIAFQTALAGRYSIDRELGRGGMGIVYLTHEVHLDRLVAVKLLPPEMARQSRLRESFLREARLAAKLSHPNIIPIHAVEETGEFVYYVMTFVDGETLATRVRNRGPLHAAEGARVLREVAWALAYAHGQGVVHRDVKPDNILLETGTGRVLVADFGIAAAADDAAGPQASGTPEFMSPEQALGGRVDGRADIYSLGVTAYYTLSGRLPFEGRSATEVLAKHVTETPAPLSSLGVPVPRRLASLVDRCLTKDSPERPTADMVAEQIGLTLEARREIPAPLRAFVKRTGRINGPGTMIAGAALLPVSVSVAAFLGGAAGFSTLALGLTVPPVTYMVVAARRLMRHGFRHQDVAPGFQAELEQAREEYALSAKTGSNLVERVLGHAAKVGAVVSGVVLPASIAGFFWTSRVLQAATVLAPVLTVVAGTAHLALRQRHRDVDTEFWASVWTGILGRFAFSVAGSLGGEEHAPAAATHRATELSLGLAAEELFAGLPKETARSLGDLPAVVRRLQEDARLLRAHGDEMSDALAAAGDGAASEAYSDIRATRDAVRMRLGETVAALETIRLNLLRLHVGTGSVEGLTTHLDLAEELSRQAERLIAARAEIDPVLPESRRALATPI